MKQKAEAVDIQMQRRDNYATHFQSRQQVNAIAAEDESLLARMRNVAEVIRAPKLNDFGCDDFTDEEWKQIIELANQNGVQANLCLRWYLSDKEWDAFQAAWQNLPEPDTQRFFISYEPEKRPVDK